MNEVRISKYFTDCGILSRRAAEREILLGRVTVNGSPAEIGQKINPEADEVRYLGKLVKATTKKQYRYILLNKPRGYITTMKDEKGRHTVAELIQTVGGRVYPVGRLDMDSEGLLLFTDDGNLTNRLTHPRHEISKTYQVTIRGAILPEQLELLRSPLVLDGYRIRPVQVKVLRSLREETVLEMVLFEGRNRQIRRMCEIAGLRITSLIRTAIGKIKIGSLPSGKWRALTDQELKLLMGTSNNFQKP